MSIKFRIIWRTRTGAEGYGRAVFDSRQDAQNVIDYSTMRDYYSGITHRVQLGADIDSAPVAAWLASRERRLRQ